MSNNNCDCDCCGQAFACPDLLATWTQPDGVASTIANTGQTFTYYGPTWMVESEQLVPGVGGGFLNLGGFLVKMCACCTRQGNIPFIPSYNWFVEMNIYENVPGEGGTLGFGWAQAPLISGEFIGGYFKIGGSVAGAAQTSFVTTGLSISPWPSVAPGATDAVDGSLVRVIMGTNGIAVYVDGIPYGFAPVVDFLTAPVDPSNMPFVWMIVGGVPAGGGTTTLRVDNLHGGCASLVDETPFIESGLLQEDLFLLLQEDGSSILV